MPGSETKRVAIVTDSGSSLMPGDSYIEKDGINVVPLTINWGDDESVFDGKLAPSEFYKRMATEEELPSTAAPSPRQVQDALLNTSGGTILAVTISAELSATNKAFHVGSSSVEEEDPNKEVRIIDSRSVSAGTGLLVQLAAEMSKEGHTIDEIEDRLKKIIAEDRLRLIAAIASLKNLHKGGRVSGIQNLVANLLRINLLLKTEDGKLEPQNKVRTMQRAVRQMVSQVDDTERVAVLHTNNQKNAEEMARQIALKLKLEDERVSVWEAGAALGVHAGEGALGVAWIIREN